MTTYIYTQVPIFLNFCHPVKTQLSPSPFLPNPSLRTQKKYTGEKLLSHWLWRDMLISLRKHTHKMTECVAPKLFQGLYLKAYRTEKSLAQVG